MGNLQHGFEVDEDRAVLLAGPGHVGSEVFLTLRPIGALRADLGALDDVEVG